MSRLAFGVLGFVALLSTIPSTRAAEPVLRSPATAVAAPLAGIPFTAAGKLSRNGQVHAPREDSRVPELMVGLLRDETTTYISPWCSFDLVEGRPVWTWFTGMTAHVAEPDPEALHRRLVDRLDKLGFAPLPGTPDSLPRIWRTGERPLQYRKSEPQQNREWTVELGSLARLTGGKNPAVGIDLAVVVRGTQKIDMPKFSDVMDAHPTLAAPTHGERTIPRPVIEFLSDVPVVHVELSGTGTTWYALSVNTPESSLKALNLQEGVEQRLVAAGFQRDTSRFPSIPGVEPLFHYYADGTPGMSWADLDRFDGNGRLRLRVQP